MIQLKKKTLVLLAFYGSVHNMANVYLSKHNISVEKKFSLQISFGAGTHQTDNKTLRPAIATFYEIYLCSIVALEALT